MFGGDQVVAFLNAAVGQKHVVLEADPAMAAETGGRDHAGEFVPAERQQPDPLMGWVGSGDTQNQVRLRFGTREQAVAYAEANGLAYEIEEPKHSRERFTVGY